MTDLYGTHERATRRRSGRGPMARWLAPPLSLLIAAGCTAHPQGGPVDAPVADGGATGSAGSVPFADCAGLTAPPRPTTVGPGAVTGSSAGAGGAATSGLPDLTLPCFTGGRPLRLAQVRGPAVLNLWGSYCGPCREELPAVQRLADRASGALHVIGVDTGDARDAAASFAADAGVSVPTLFDREQRLLLALGKRALPATIVLDAAGRTHVYNGPALDDAALTALVRDHAGVVVPS